MVNIAVMSRIYFLKGLRKYNTLSDFLDFTSIFSGGIKKINAGKILRFVNRAMNIPLPAMKPSSANPR